MYQQDLSRYVRLLCALLQNVFSKSVVSTVENNDWMVFICVKDKYKTRKCLYKVMCAPGFDFLIFCLVHGSKVCYPCTAILIYWCKATVTGWH